MSDIRKYVKKRQNKDIGKMESKIAKASKPVKKQKTEEKSRPRSQSQKKGGNRTQGKKTQNKDKQTVQGPLQNLTFVITGVLEAMEREQLTDILKSLGAKVTGSVSGRTSYLIYGQRLEDGREYSKGKKWQEAQNKGVETMNEEQLDQFLKDKTGSGLYDARVEENEKQQSQPQQKQNEDKNHKQDQSDQL